MKVLQLNFTFLRCRCPAPETVRQWGRGLVTQAFSELLNSP